MATRVQEPGLTKAPATTSRRPMTRAGAILGHVPDRSVKALVSAGLQAQGFEAHFIIEGQEGPFCVVSAQHELDADVLAARAFISGLLFACRPPDPLAAVVVTVRSEWARFTGVKGLAVAGWSFGCGAPGCIVVSSVRVTHQALAVEQIVTLGWRYSDDQGWVCPTCAGTVTP